MSSTHMIINNQINESHITFWSITEIIELFGMVENIIIGMHKTLDIANTIESPRLPWKYVGSENFLASLSVSLLSVMKLL